VLTQRIGLVSMTQMTSDLVTEVDKGRNLDLSDEFMEGIRRRSRNNEYLGRAF
jgi:hypothetical protein